MSNITQGRWRRLPASYYTPAIRHLIAGMLQPSTSARLTLEEVVNHPWRARARTQMPFPDAKLP